MRRTVIGLAVATAVFATVVGSTVAGTGVSYAAEGPARGQVVGNDPGAIPLFTPATPEVPQLPKVDGKKPLKLDPKVDTKRRAASSCLETGPGQREVEKYIAARQNYYGKVIVDGRQSLTDCKAIKKFQARFGIQPAAGYAGTVTKNVVRRLTAARLKSCGEKGRAAVCVDLTTQTFWITDGKRIKLGPSPIRTGRAGLATPAGTFRISDKKRMTTSSEFKVKLPYWQRFYRDMGFHQTTTYLYEGSSPGSHGCINLPAVDAKSAFGLTKNGTTVRIFGRKPG